MKIEEFVKTVREMRKHQIDFYMTRNTESLKRAKQYEKKVDDLISEHYSQAKNMKLWG